MHMTQQDNVCTEEDVQHAMNREKWLEEVAGRDATAE